MKKSQELIVGLVAVAALGGAAYWFMNRPAGDTGSDTSTPVTGSTAPATSTTPTFGASYGLPKASDGPAAFLDWLNKSAQPVVVPDFGVSVVSAMSPAPSTVPSYYGPSFSSQYGGAQPFTAQVIAPAEQWTTSGSAADSGSSTVGSSFTVGAGKYY